MSIYWRALSYFRDDVWRIALQVGLISVATVLSLLQAYPLAILIDCVFVAPDKAGANIAGNWVYNAYFSIAPSGVVGQIILLAVLTLLLRLMQEALTMSQTMLNIRIGYNGVMRVRCALFDRLQALSLAYHKSQPQGDSIYRLSYDTYGFQTILNVIVQTAFVSGVTLLFMSIIMLSMNWVLTLLALGVAPLLWWTTRIYSKILLQKTTEAKEVDAELMTTTQRSVSTIGLVQAFGRERDEYQRFHTAVHNTVSAYLRLHWQEVLYWLFINSIFAIGVAMLIGVGGYIVWSDQIANPRPDGLTVGELSVFVQYFLLQLYGPLKELSSAPAMLQGGAAGVKRVLEVIDRDPVISDGPNAMHLQQKSRALVFDEVSFGYREGQRVLKGLNLRIEPGQMVALVGSSGVGKTTLLNLLPRFYDPVSGAIRLDEHDLRDVKVADVRRHIALVLQDSVVLPTSVAENIAYVAPGATEEQIIAAAKLAGAHEFISELEDGYSTDVSESGSNLSGGQKQRISIARALLTEAPIIVMDEPTSALDPQHEAHIIATLQRLHGTRTIVLVSHRLSSVKQCDVIFVLHDGAIVEQGTHDELVAKRGHYFEMAKHQFSLEADGEPTDGGQA